MIVQIIAKLLTRSNPDIVRNRFVLSTQHRGTYHYAGYDEQNADRAASLPPRRFTSIFRLAVCHFPNRSPDEVQPDGAKVSGDSETLESNREPVEAAQALRRRPV